MIINTTTQKVVLNALSLPSCNNEDSCRIVSILMCKPCSRCDIVKQTKNWKEAKRKQHTPTDASCGTDIRSCSEEYTFGNTTW